MSNARKPATEPSVAASKVRPVGKRWVWWLLTLYWLGYGGFGAVVWLLGDRMWLGTVLLFSPRHLLAWPLVTMVAILPFCRRVQGVCAVTIIAIGLLQVSQLSLPWGLASSWSRPANSQVLRVVTLNAARFPEGAERFQRLLTELDPDVVVLEELADNQPLSWPAGWSKIEDGELLIASRYPLTASNSVQRKLPGRWPRAVALFATVKTPHSDVTVGVAHLLSPRPGLSEIVSMPTVLDLSKRGQVEKDTAMRRSESDSVATAAERQGTELILAGDFNMPADSSIYREHWSKWRNAYSSAGLGFGNTVFVQQGPFEFAARIDHVLFTSPWRCSRCWVGPDVGSDHRPLIAELWKTNHVTTSDYSERRT